MNNEFHTTEETLRTGQQTRLSASEKADIKASLLSRAKYHTYAPLSKATTTNPFSLWQSWRVGMAFAMVVLVTSVGGVGAVAAASLPGDTLYATKVHVVEEMVAFAQWSDEAKITYQHERMERRLGEVKALEESGEDFDTEVVDDLVGAMADVAYELESLADAADATEVVNILTTLNDSVSVSSVITETLAEEEVDAALLDSFTDIEDLLQTLHEEQVDDLLEAGTTTTSTYISQQLRTVSAELAEEDLSATTTALVASFVIDAQMALDADETEAAVQSVSEALRSIMTEEYDVEFAEQVAAE